MMQQYYIHDNGEIKGPFELLAMIRKIKNGDVNANSLVSLQPDTAPQAAIQFSELAPSFAEQSSYDSIGDSSRRNITVGSCLRVGIDYIKSDNGPLAATGILLILALIIGVMLQKIGIIGYVLSVLVGYVLLSGYLLYILRISRGQTVDFDYIISRIMSNLPSLLVSGIIISIGVSVGSALLLGPGVAILSIYMFTPWLITERGMHFWDAMEASRKGAFKQGWSSFGTIFMLNALFCLSFVMMIVPAIIVMPIVMLAMADIYDKFFDEL